MSTTLQTEKPSALRLPDIELSELPEATKDFLIASSATGQPVTEVIREVLRKAAAEHGFNPKTGKDA